MKWTSTPATLATALLVAGSICGCSGKGADQASTQGAPESAAPAKENKYAELANLPDFSGVWEPARMDARPPAPPAGSTGAAGATPPPPPPTNRPQFTPEYAKKFAAFQEANKGRAGINFVSQVANCIPPGVPGSMNQPYPIEFLFTPGRVTILIETYSMVRRIYMDNNGPPEPDFSYQGNSTGKWE